MVNEVQFSNGHRYTDDSNPATGMGNKGHKVRLIPMLADMIVEMANRIAEMVGYRDTTLNAKGAAEAARDVALNAASTAVMAPGTQATSTSALTLATGNHNLTTQAGKAFALNMPVLISAGAGLYMYGQVAAYNSGTGAMTINVTQPPVGTGTYSNWTICLSGPAQSPASIPVTALAIGTATAAQTLRINLAGTGIEGVAEYWQWRPEAVAQAYDAATGRPTTTTETVLGQPRVTTRSYNTDGSLAQSVTTYQGHTLTINHSYSAGRYTGSSYTEA